MTEIIRVQHGPGVAETIGAIIATSFHEQEISAWTIPPDDDRRRVMPPLFSMAAESALVHGEVHATADMSAVAVWFPNGAEPLPEFPGRDARVEAFAGPHTERIRRMEEEMGKRHPQDPHHYLAFLAVLPGHQGRRTGTRLLADYHRKLDEARMPAYLEASSTRSRRLYLRHGYQDLGDPIFMPDGPPMFPMWRPSRSAASARLTS
ncbi:GNAT family N-acetyltransferase [Spongiactinospora sp. TRM90649]|uniref:GNAT family N-acetyltransferase n=1 Tax=Spongiactinospora sp. TRM90649 TaxID=3031114 RepID=UPI0023F8C129|nr:GNAT family N-acetyltransferase [Spongiactinospora sp. TRM90649]MDF5757748.1 GNAT family N-acetyltransferase [Spongiactinospora sp. TRM90649]